MKKIYLFSLAALLCIGAIAQNAPYSVQGIPNAKVQTPTLQKAGENTDFTFDDILFWVGQGENKAAITIQWNVEGETHAKVWGYRWNGEATGYDMLKAVAAADDRLYYMTQTPSQYGYAIGGIGYDTDYDYDTAIVWENEIRTFQNGLKFITSGTFDNWKAKDTADYWQSGWGTGFWYYYTQDINGDYKMSGVASDFRTLTDGSWDLWSFAPGFEEAAFKPVEAAAVNATKYTQGTFFFNQDWIGHRNASINFLSDEGTWTYDVYRKANPGNGLGATGSYATIYGDKMFLLSKQAKDAGDTTSEGNGRLVITDAKTLKKIKSFEELKGNDGRSFAAVNKEKGYIGTSGGILSFDMKRLELGDIISGSEGEIGMMACLNKYLFAVNSSKGVLVINTADNSLVKTVTSTTTIGGLTVSKDGNIWIAADTELIKIDAKTLETTTLSLSSETAIPNSWYAWTPDPFFASAQTNTLYWGNNGGWTGSTIFYKMDLEAENPQPEPLIDIKDSGWYLYGSAVRIDPVTDHIYMQLYKSYGSTDYEVREYTNTGQLVREIALDQANYWFPEQPLFPDNADPMIAEAVAPVTIQAMDPFTIDLSEVASDQDNLTAAMDQQVIAQSNTDVLTASIKDGNLEVTPLTNGESTVTVEFNSNGKTVTTEIAITINKADGISEQNNIIRNAYSFHGTVVVNGLKDFHCTLYTLNGAAAYSFTATSDAYQLTTTPPAGIYILRGAKAGESVSFKLLIQ